MFNRTWLIQFYTIISIRLGLFDQFSGLKISIMYNLDEL